jgi:serine/threonine protein kinase
MGEVWRAHDTRPDRVVAIKVLPAHLSDDQLFQQRFRREAHAAARLDNPHVIPIHDYGEIDGRLYVDMRLINGRDLHTVLAAGPIQPARAVRIIEQVAKALHAASVVPAGMAQEDSGQVRQSPVWVARRGLAVGARVKRYSPRSLRMNRANPPIINATVTPVRSVLVGA